MFSVENQRNLSRSNRNGKLNKFKTTSLNISDEKNTKRREKNLTFLKF